MFQIWRACQRRASLLTVDRRVQDTHLRRFVSLCSSASPREKGAVRRLLFLHNVPRFHKTRVSQNASV